MKEIKINVADKVASAIGSPVIVCGNSNYKITFIFDSEWGAYQEKTARFTFRRDGIDKYIDVLFSGTSCTAPILTNIERVSIGVYAGDLRTTTGAEIRCKKSILCRGGLKHEQPPEDVYNQILETVGKKLGSEGGTVTGDYFKDGNTFIHEGNLELIEPKINEEINEVLANEKVVETASGSAITIESANAPLQALKLYGKTTQDGTPTPTEPIELKSVGDSGSFEVGVYGGNLAKLPTSFKSQNLYGVEITVNEDGSITFNGTTSISGIIIDFENVYLQEGKSYTLSGFKGMARDQAIFYINSEAPFGTKLIQSNGAETKTCLKSGLYPLRIYIYTGTTLNQTIYPMLNIGSTALPYEPCNKQSLTLTDTLRGIGDIADEKDFARGVTTQRFNEIDLGTLDWIYEAETNRFRSPLGQTVKEGFRTIKCLCDIYSTIQNGETYNANWENTAYIASTNIYIHDKRYTDASALKSALSGVKFVYELATPIETPLSETELNAYRQLHTNSGTTTILGEADMTLDYYTPKGQALGNIHSQVNKDYLKLQQAIISTGGN